MNHEIGDFVPVWVYIGPDKIVIEEEDTGKEVTLLLSEAKRLRDILNDLEL